MKVCHCARCSRLQEIPGHLCSIWKENDRPKVMLNCHRFAQGTTTAPESLWDSHKEGEDA